MKKSKTKIFKGTTPSGHTKLMLTVPKAWVAQMGIKQDDRDVVLYFDGDIITNPPYKFAAEFVSHALDLIPAGNKVFMFLKLQFLEGKARRALFDTKQLKTLYVSSSRIICAKNGKFEKCDSSAVAYAWFEFQKGFKGDPVIKWIN